jgi:hypothetical protein
MTTNRPSLATAERPWHNPRMANDRSLRWRIGAISAAVAIVGVTISAPLQPAAATATVFRCTNNVSGAQWNVIIDFDNATADSYPAEITGRQIYWHNTADQGFYYLNRITGDLTILRASSTGGYEQHVSCRSG